MNGATALLGTLVDADVRVCFANPGTSEMHFVAALDAVPEMRGILVLFEGVATGAADGYARVTGTPAAVLLHLGPGQGNGLANLHNARRAGSPILNIVGDHATYHGRYDAPLTSDISSVSATFSNFVRTSTSSDAVAGDALDALHAAIGPPAGVATLILPADVSWNEVTNPQNSTRLHRGAPIPSRDALRSAARDLRDAAHPIIVLGGEATRAPCVVDAARIAEATGATLLTETFPPISARGAGTPIVGRLSYVGEFATAQLAECDLLVLIGARPPTSFFAYPGAPSDLVPPDTTVLTLADGSVDITSTLHALCDDVDAEPTPLVVHQASVPDPPDGPLTPKALADAIACTMHEGTIVVDEANTGGIYLAGATAGAAPHEWMTLTGGAIGYGMPAALGAAVGRPDARVLCVEADGSALYTFQALWSMARERANVTVVIISNRSYAILNMELARVGAVASGSAAASMLDLSNPALDFVSLAHGLGVPGVRVTSAEELTSALRASYELSGPMLIEAELVEAPR